MANAWSKLWSLITGSNVGGKPVTPQAVKDAVANGRPIPTGLPVARHAEGLPVGTALPPLPVAQRLGDVPEQSQQFISNRYNNTLTGAPIGGGLHGMVSTWILAAGFEPTATPVGQQQPGEMRGVMTVRFLSMATVAYDNVPVSAWAGLWNAPSHGKFLYQHVVRAKAPWAVSYRLISPAIRRVTQAMKIRNG